MRAQQAIPPGPGLPGAALPAAVRLGIPAAALLGALSDPAYGVPALLIAFISALDIAGQRWGPPAWRQRPGFYRDVAYALGFYLAYLHDFQVPVLLLWPVVVVEAVVLKGPRIGPRVLGAGLLALVLRLGETWSRYPGRLAAHPPWVAGVLLALGAAVWAGTALRRQRELDAAVAVRGRQVREAIEVVIDRLLDASGVGREGAEAGGVPTLLDQVCEEIGDPDRCRAAADTLARLVEEEQIRRTLLTEREREILPWLATGLSYQTIAGHLMVSSGTVRAHAAAIMRKAGTHSRSETVQWARRLRLLPEEENARDPAG